MRGTPGRGLDPVWPGFHPALPQASHIPLVDNRSLSERLNQSRLMNAIFLCPLATRKFSALSIQSSWSAATAEDPFSRTGTGASSAARGTPGGVHQRRVEEHLRVVAEDQPSHRPAQHTPTKRCKTSTNVVVRLDAGRKDAPACSRAALAARRPTSFANAQVELGPRGRSVDRWLKTMRELREVRRVVHHERPPPSVRLNKLLRPELIQSRPFGP